jgi:hypothetical protein
VNGPTAAQDLAPRRFGLGDALILMIALAISLDRFRALHWFQSFPSDVVWCGHAIAELAGWSRWVAWGQTRQDLMFDVLLRFTEQLMLKTLCPVLLGLMVAQPLLRLRRPRPVFSQVARQSGFATCMIGIFLVILLLPLGDLWFTGYALALGLTRTIISLMIWPVLGLPPWHAERSWIDRLGRGVGWGWIVSVAFGVLLERIGRI